MTEQRNEEESLLIDCLLGRCEEREIESVRRRLEGDAEFRKRHEDIGNALSALRLSVEVEPPEDLVAKTMARIRSAKQTEALLAQQDLGRRAVWPMFSLRELGAMAAAVLILAAVFVPSVRQSRRRALINECSSNLGQIGAALQTFANDHNSLPPSSATRQRWLSAANEPAASNSVGLFRLVRAGYTSPVRFQCPAVGGGSFVVQAGMSDFPAGRYVNYSYQHALGTDWVHLNNSALTAVAGSMAILADATPLFLDGQFRRDHLQAASDNHGQTGQNVLYLDMHVEWKNSAAAGVNGNNIYLAEGIYEYRGDETPVSLTDSFLLPPYSYCGLPTGP